MGRFICSVSSYYSRTFRVVLQMGYICYTDKIFRACLFILVFLPPSLTSLSICLYSLSSRLYSPLPQISGTSANSSPNPSTALSSSPLPTPALSTPSNSFFLLFLLLILCSYPSIIFCIFSGPPSLPHNDPSSLLGSFPTYFRISPPSIPSFLSTSPPSFHLHLAFFFPSLPFHLSSFLPSLPSHLPSLLPHLSIHFSPLSSHFLFLFLSFHTSFHLTFLLISLSFPPYLLMSLPSLSSYLFLTLLLFLLFISTSFSLPKKKKSFIYSFTKALASGAISLSRNALVQENKQTNEFIYRKNTHMSILSQQSHSRFET